ncbi:hypothetical protein NQ317_005829 [Molorchus minor]|uniref:Uncharacterized protein n=1 Tax=Molorchus minor TaxID=1323400 RepID=A0ABQ9JZ95_9CUCU|nr:hypothetical protein NQ317_005829 [Molorchus minor]
MLYLNLQIKPSELLLGEVLTYSACRKHGVNMPYAFCTREKTPWCEYAENAQHGPTTKMLQELAQIHNMENIVKTISPKGVILMNPFTILEGDTGHPVFEVGMSLFANCNSLYRSTKKMFSRNLKKDEAM